MSLPDWHAMFVPDVSILEIMLRGTIVYLALFVLLRFLLKRQAGAIGMTDLLVIVMIADAVQNAMSADYKSVPEGLILVMTILFWSYVLEWLGHRYPVIGRIVHPPPLDLVRDGQLIRRNLQKELITKEELMSQLREQGVADISEVQRACMEGDGHISVIKKEGDAGGKRREPAL